MKKMLLFTTLMAAGALVAANPILGTWKMNVAKSKFSPGPAPKSVTSTYTESDGWVVITTDAVSADGTPTKRESRVKADGKEYPFENVYGKGTTVIKQKDPYNWTSVQKLDGGNTVTTKGMISKDGKTRTQTASGTNAKGEKVHTVTVWERQ